MADKKTNDFWGNTDDDFWNKPVITGDWLNNDDINSENTESRNPYAESQNPYTDTGNPYAESQNWYGDTGNPYANVGNPYMDAGSDRYDNRKEPRRGRTADQRPENKKNFPVFTMINIFFFALALIVVSVSILGAGELRDKADYRNRKLNYERVVIDEEGFPVYDNNRVTFAWEAVIIFNQDTEKQLIGMPDGEMLIAVPVQVESEEYKSGQYALRDMFIGCDLGGQRVYRRCVRDETVLVTLGMMGFNQEEMLSFYGLGNGSNENGFFFFFVPEGTREITLYAEERRTEHKISILTRRYEKNLVISDRMDREEWLKEIRESEGWQ